MRNSGNTCREKADACLYASSFRDGPKDQIRNLEIPGSMLRIATGMTRSLFDN
jgi:hypothetical protein